MTKPEEVLRKLDDGWELSNRGTGWWMNAERAPYGAVNKFKVDDEIVNALHVMGKIKIDMPYNTSKARLPHQPEHVIRKA